MLFVFWHRPFGSLQGLKKQKRQGRKRGSKLSSKQATTQKRTK